MWEAGFSQPCCPREARGGASVAGQNAALATPNNFALLTDDFDVLMEESLGWLRLQLAFLTVPGLRWEFRPAAHTKSCPGRAVPAAGRIPAAFQLHSSCFPAACRGGALSMAWRRVPSAVPSLGGPAVQGGSPSPLPSVPAQPVPVAGSRCVTRTSSATTSSSGRRASR